MPCNEEEGDVVRHSGTIRAPSIVSTEVQERKILDLCRYQRRTKFTVSIECAKQARLN